jgi:flavin reductase (DIM6/NTAB) family NADH-FMN oxidoreductase RutF
MEFGMSGSIAMHESSGKSPPLDQIRPEDFRHVVGSFATGVTIITTTSPEGEAIGVTANSFSSVSLDPPLVLFSIARKLHSHAAFERSNHFSINVLHEGQLPLAKQFAISLGEKWKDVEFEMGAFGCRLISQAAATLECEKYASYDGGDHIIYVMRVLRINADPTRTPLVFWRGKFATIEVEH